MLLDSDVLIDAFRGYAPAVNWLTNYTSAIAISGLVAMELLQGCRTAAEQQRVERELNRFTIHWPTVMDCERAYRDFATCRLSHNVGLLDCLIAHTAVGLNQPLAMFNVKHYNAIAGLQTVQPY